MIDKKSLFTSKTFWGAAVAGLAAILSLFGRTIGQEEQSLLVDAILALMGAGGALWAVYGRIRAEKRIK